MRGGIAAALPRSLFLAVLSLLSGFLLAQGPPLTVANAGPRGEVASLAEANEVRVVFSEPMVALGRIPDPATAPFFKMTPPVKGAFRWSGTRTLLFTPEAPLPFATKFEVEISGAASAVSGKRLEEPTRFSFTTPALRLLRTSWYRKTGKSDSSVVVVLQFNQPVRSLAIAKDTRLSYVPYAWSPPPLPNGVERWKAQEPQGFAAFEAKAAAASAAAAKKETVLFRAARVWNRKWFPSAKEMAVLETTSAPVVNARMRVRIGKDARGTQGNVPAGKAQEYTISLEPAFFVTGFRCETACDPEDYNPIRFSSRVEPRPLSRALSVTDVTERQKPKALSGKPPSPRDSEYASEVYPRTPSEYEEDEDFWSSAVTPEEAGFVLAPARSYSARIDGALRSEDGQTLGYSWIGVVENWRQNAFSSFGSGHGVWEASGGPELPFSARNLKTLTQWIFPLKAGELVPALKLLQERGFSLAPTAAPATPRRLAPVPDRIQSYGLNLKPALSERGTGIVWAAIQDGEPIPKARKAEGPDVRATLVQVTNLGISVKDSPQNTLVLVTRLDDARPVAGARVTIRTPNNAPFWSGETGENGIAAAPATDLRLPERWWELAFVVTAEKEGDIAYVGSDWNEGVSPWYFGLNYDLSEAKPILRGSVFADRGVYKLGEEVRVKAILRADTAKGILLLPEKTPLEVAVVNSQGAEVDKRTVPLNAFSAADWTFTLPKEAPLGGYTVTAKASSLQREISGSFLVAAYRRPDFRVDVTLAGESSLAGSVLTGVISGRYLFGAAMKGRAVAWTYSRTPLFSVPEAVAGSFPPERWVFLDTAAEERSRERETLQRKGATLDAEGQLRLDLPTERSAGKPYQAELEAEVTDLSRQTLAGRASLRVDPAPWYIGIKQPPTFAEAGKGLDAEIIAADLSGKAAAGVPVRVKLSQIQWHSVRRAEGKGFFTWETERRETPAGSWTVTTAEKPVPLHVPLARGGYYVLTASASDGAGRSTKTSTGFYALGSGYTAWERFDHNRIDLVPEQKTYRPGDTARILVKSPWEEATALLTTEREGVRTQKTFRLTSTQQTVAVPIDEGDIPNVYVSVLLLKGRTGTYTTKDASDPGKPAFRLGYAELYVEDVSKRLSVAVKADKEEYRPAEKARVQVAVTDASGRAGAEAEVTLWAVDYGVLSLTGYQPPNVADSVYVRKALQVSNEDSRQNIVSRRVMVPKGAPEGGGGGEEEGPGSPVRRDFRVLAFWLGSLVTDAQGKAQATVALPESLTTYRIMAVAADKVSRFGRGEDEVRISKPVLLQAAFPRFLALGDTALFGAVAHNQLKEKGTAVVTIQSLDPAVLEIVGEARRVLDLPGGGSEEARFTARAKEVGNARVRMSLTLAGESDSFEDVLPVRILSSPEVVAAYGQAETAAREALAMPARALPGFGGLSLELSSTALVGLGEGARYLVEYPYGCAEQRASSTVALLLAADLGEAFHLPGIEPGKLKETIRETLKELEEFQCENGGFSFWKGECASVSPYLTSYVLSVLQQAKRLGQDVPGGVLEKGYTHLESSLGESPPANESFWPAYTAWQAFAAKVLTEGGRNQDSAITRLYGYADRMPVFALSYLFDAISAKGEKGERREGLLRRMTNAVLPEGGSAHVEELSDPYLLWFWNSNVRSTAIVLGSLLRHTDDRALVPGMVRWLLRTRKNGRWGNTQENAFAMAALVDYYRKYEKEVPDFTALVKLGPAILTKEVFEGRSTEARTRALTMRELLAKGPPGGALPLSFEKEGKGTLHYTARLKYATADSSLSALDSGFKVERTFSPVGENTGANGGNTYKAGELVRVTLTLALPKERRFVAVTDPLPAGFEPVESYFATTASDLAREQREQESGSLDWTERWTRGGFDHVERHDDRVLLFATRLSEGKHTFSYVARATTGGTFRTAPTHAEEMYDPEVFGRAASDVVEVKLTPDPKR